MTELIGKKYCKISYEFVDAAILPEDATLNGKSFIKGDYIIRFSNGTQDIISKDIFERDFREVKISEELLDIKEE